MVVSFLFPFGAYMGMEVLPRNLSGACRSDDGETPCCASPLSASVSSSVIFTERLPYTASYGGLWGTVRRVDAAEDMKLYPLG